MEQEITNNLITNFIGRKILYFEQIDSTQKEAKRMLLDPKIIDGTIIVANYQTNGIGTKDRIWYTGEGKDIAFTLTLFPNCDVTKLSNITITIAECMIKAIKSLYDIEDILIKYPNDIVLNGRKLGGILTESHVNEGIVKSLLIGIGLNVNETNFPKSIENIATSLAKKLNKRCSREIIIANFCNIFEEKYTELINKNKSRFV
jgi:BirA family biotin operon repressor/biotin-[acetyl-CoA-carboxylase] ligase